MSTNHPKIDLIKQEDQLVAYLQFYGSRADIQKHFDKLYAEVKEQTSGPAIVLIYGECIEKGRMIEICLPVSQTVESGEIKSRVLPGGEMVVYKNESEQIDLQEAYQEFFSFLEEKQIGIACGATREIYPEGKYSTDAAKMIEFQLPLLMPLWLNRLENGLDEHVDQKVKASILQGSELLTPLSSPTKKSEWAVQAINKLDEQVADPQARHNILCGCSHRFPEERVAALREIYQQDPNVDRLLKRMNDDLSWNGDPYYEGPVLDVNKILVTKIPVNRPAFEAAKNENEKRAAYCHCPMVRQAVSAGGKLSPTYCNCGAGWYKTLWEGILEQPVEVELSECLTQGAEQCSFIIHLPESVSP